jgi:molybdenum cofactor cytidylyltransferase
MGFSKLEYEIGGLSVLARSVKAVSESALDGSVIVVGPSLNLEEKRGPVSLTSSKFKWVMNRNPEAGISSSLRSGMVSLSPDTDGAMIILADQPLITPQVIDELIGVFGNNPNLIVFPLIHGRRTTPVIFPSSLFPELLTVTGDKGGREVLMRYPKRAFGVEMGGRYDDRDLDTPEDLEAIKRIIEKEKE